MPGPTDPRERRILCTSCNAPMSIAAEAKSVSCPTCHQRVVTEAVVVKGYVAVRRYPVANRISITKKGIVYAAVRADDLDIVSRRHEQAETSAPFRIRKCPQEGMVTHHPTPHAPGLAP